MTGSTAESSLAAVISPTGTRVRRKTASIISPWLKLGTITPSFTVYPPTMRLAGTFRLKTGSPVEESWCTSFLVAVPRSKVPSSVSSRITTQLPLMRASSEFTAAVTKLAKAMPVMKRPRLSTWSRGSSPSFHSRHAHFAAQHAGIDAHVGDGLGEREGAAPGLAVFTGLRRSGERFVAR